MNIFMLDSNPELAAQYHYDTHIVKMILESAQILCTVNHKSFDVINLLAVPNIEVGELTPPALAMPEEFITNDPIESYRNYYAFGKKHLLKYTNTNKPKWLIERLKMT